MYVYWRSTDMPFYSPSSSGSGLPEGGQPGQILGVTDSGETLWVNPSGGVFRGEWAASSMLARWDFSDGEMPEVFSGSHVSASIDKPESSISYDPDIAVISTLPNAGVIGSAGVNTHCARLRSNVNNTNSSTLTLDLSSLSDSATEIKFWAGFESLGYDNSWIRIFRLDGVDVYSDPDNNHPFQEYSFSLNNPQTFEWEARSDTNVYNAWTYLAVTGIEIYGTAEPYMYGEFVTSAGKMWKSMMDSNPAEPGTDAAWVEVLELPRPSGTTAERPDPATAGVGYPYFDTTLSQPLWSTGAGWVDATGTAAV